MTVIETNCPNTHRIFNRFLRWLLDQTHGEHAKLAKDLLYDVLDDVESWKPTGNVSFLKRVCSCTPTHRTTPSHSESEQLYSMGCKTTTMECVAKSVSIEEWATLYYEGRARLQTESTPTSNSPIPTKTTAGTEQKGTRKKKKEPPKWSPGCQAMNNKHAIAFFGDDGIVMDPTTPQTTCSIQQVFPPGDSEQSIPNSIQVFQLLFRHGKEAEWQPWCSCEVHQTNAKKPKRQACKPDYGTNQTMIGRNDSEDPSKITVVVSNKSKFSPTQSYTNYYLA